VCVASPAGLDGVLAVLRDALCGDDAHADLDLTRIILLETRAFRQYPIFCGSTRQKWFVLR
jgi:hypothetical protein